MHHNEKNIKVAVIGAGYWGKNLVRNFADLASLAAVCDPDLKACTPAAKQGVLTTNNFSDLFRDPEIDAVAISSPAASHFSIAKEALLSGKDVFVDIRGSSLSTFAILYPKGVACNPFGPPG